MCVIIREGRGVGESSSLEAEAKWGSERTTKGSKNHSSLTFVRITIQFCDIIFPELQYMSDNEIRFSNYR